MKGQTLKSEQNITEKQNKKTIISFFFCILDIEYVLFLELRTEQFKAKNGDKIIKNTWNNCGNKTNKGYDEMLV
jgi:hypothetical protein